MGLFDIFRRRAKHPVSDAPSSSATPDSVATSETTSVASSAAEQLSVSATGTSVVSAETVDQPVASERPATVTSTTATSSVAPVSVASASTESVASSVAGVPASVASEASVVASVSTTTTEPVSETVSAVTSETTATSAVSSETSETSAETAASTESLTVTDSVVTTEAPVTASEAQPEPVTEPESEVSDEQLYDKGLEKTRHTFGERLNALLANFRHVDEGFFDDLEETLIGADVGFDMAVKLSDELRDEVKLQNAKSSKDVQNVIVEKMVEIYDQAADGEESTALTFAKEGPTVILFVGVNGVGKTTTIGKMANRYHQAGKKVLLAAADTFRAGATEQLKVWAERGHVDIVKGQPQSDPAAVVFDAVRKAKAEDYDILFVDTAGRLQNKVNLMNELSKMKRIITREIPTAPHEVLLVLDATTGQNALTQAKLFKESTDVTGIVLTKLDGTARGGIVLAIRNELHVPVKFIGLGEQINDLRPFDPNEFVYGLFKGLIDVSALDKK